MARLTELSVNALKPPPTGQKTYRDDLIPGFGCRVSSGGTKTFVLMYGAQRRLITIGRVGIISLSDARTKAKRVLAEQTLGKHRPTSITYEDAKKLFLAFKETTAKPRTVKDYIRILRRYGFGETHLEDISPQDILRKLDKLKEAPSERKHCYVALRTFFKWATRRNYLTHNPMEKLEPPAKGATRKIVLTAESLKAVYQTSLNYESPFGAIVALIILTGQRRGEIAQLRREWISHNEMTITLPEGVTKNGREHIFPFGQKVAAILKMLPDDGYLFPASRTHVRNKPTTTFNGWGKAKAAFDEKAEVAGYTLHDLRRTFATTLASLQVPPHVVERLLNHVTGEISGVSAIYNRHTYLKEMRDAIGLWESHLDSLTA